MPGLPKGIDPTAEGFDARILVEAQITLAQRQGRDLFAVGKQKQAERERQGIGLK